MSAIDQEGVCETCGKGRCGDQNTDSTRPEPPLDDLPFLRAQPAVMIRYALWYREFEGVAEAYWRYPKLVEKRPSHGFTVSRIVAV